MAHDRSLKIDAAKMRCDGMSIPAIARQLGIAKSTISLWVRDIPLPEEMRGKLIADRMKGREKGLAVLRIRREDTAKATLEWGKKIVDGQLHTSKPDDWKMVAALLFWAEGCKRNTSSLGFTNSDPRMIRTFLHALRSGFPIDEKKFSCLVHLHEYHDDWEQVRFWSEATGIPTAQFSRSYLKPHTGIRKREGYQGCISLKYFDASLAKRLSALYHAFAQRTGA